MTEKIKPIGERKQSPDKAKPTGTETLDIHGIFEDQLFYDLFNARCHDTNEKPLCNLLLTLDETAMNFKEELLKKNAKNMRILNLQSMKLGTNAIISLAASLQTRKVIISIIEDR